MARNLWFRIAVLISALFITQASINGLILAGAAPSIALLVGWLGSSIVSLLLGRARRSMGWTTLGLIELGGALVAALMWQKIAVWWWPAGLIALGVAYIFLASLPPARLAAYCRTSLKVSALFIAGTGAVWALGQIITAFLLAWQGTPLLANDANPLRASFVFSSLLLVGGSLLWAVLHRRLLALALTALLLGQLAIALVINATEIGTPSAEGLFALALLVVALVCHVGTYPLRLFLPDLAPDRSPRPWRHLVQRRGRIRAALTLKALRNQEAWGLCFLLDGLALLLALVAITPVADQPTVYSPNSGPLLIVLSAGCFLSAAVAYWQQAPWLVLLTGLFLAGDIYALGRYADTPASTWPLLYFAAATAFLGLAVWLRGSSGRAWARPSLVIALGSGSLALLFALERASLAWGLGMALALAFAGALAFWGWRLAQDSSQRS